MDEINLNDPEVSKALRALEEAMLYADRRAKNERLAVWLEKKLRSAFQKQGTELLKELKKQTQASNTSPESEPSPEFSKTNAATKWILIWGVIEIATSKLFVSPLDYAAPRALMFGARAEIASLGINLSFDLANKAAAEYLKDYGALLVKGINEETRQGLRDLLSKAVNEGWSIQKTTEAIAEKFSDFSQYRSKLIAVTETADAYGEGQMQVINQLQSAGIEMEKAWSTVGDEKVSEICSANEKQGWIPAGDTFQSGHARYPGHPGCRCDLLTRVKE